MTAALTEQPSLYLEIYMYYYGVLLWKREGDAVSKYAVYPEQIALALASKVIFDTGLLTADTLLVRQDGVKRLVVEYRRPQKTGIFIEGSDASIRVPLPPLPFTHDTKRVQLQVFARHGQWETRVSPPVFCDRGGELFLV